MNRIVFVVLTFWLTGCASLSPLSSFTAMSPTDSQSKIDRLLSEHRYDKAIQLINKLPDTDEYQEQKQQLPTIETIKKKRQQYIDQLLTQSSEAAKAQQWPDALTPLKQGLKQLPGDPTLEQEYQNRLAEREAFVETQRVGLLITEAQYLLASYPYQDQISASEPKNLVKQYQHNQFERQARKIAEQLLLKGEAAFQAKDPQAMELLTLSNLLQPQPKTQAMLSELHAEQRAIEQARLKAARNRYQANVTHWQQVFDDAMTEDDLARASQAIDQLKSLKPRPKQTSELEKQLQARLNDKVKAGIARGKMLYSQGFIQQALDVWLGVQPYAPENPILKDYIARARRFINNLEKLGAP
jgi:hypothetical protein